MPRVSRSASSPGSATSSTAYPIYTTYTEEELQQAFAKLSHIGTNGHSVSSHANFAKNGSGSRGSRLIKSHECSVTFPDGTAGLCKYTRGGPAWHIFRFEQAGQAYKDLLPFPGAWRSAQLPPRHCTERMGNTIAAIEAKARELAHAAFAAAVALEHKDRFTRALDPAGYSRYHAAVPSAEKPKRPSPAARCAQPQMSIKRAKEMAGKYALCLRIGSGDTYRLIPCTGVDNQSVYDGLDEANAAWRQSEHRARRFVACLCRYSRQWELPVYNPLNADREYAALLGLNVPTESNADTAETA